MNNQFILSVLSGFASITEDAATSTESLSHSIFEMIIRFAINLGLIFILVHFVYGKKQRQKEFYFSYLAIGTVVFALCYLLSNVKIELAFALGLFAIFGIIRYRTDAIPIKEMTYLFVVIGVSVINALANNTVNFIELLIANAIIILGLCLLEKVLFRKKGEVITLIYEEIDNIHSGKSELLLKDLEERTGLHIEDYKINRIDFLRDVAEITLYVKGNSTI